MSIYHLKSITAVLIQIHGRIVITQYCTTCNYYPELGLPVVQCKFLLKKKHLVCLLEKGTHNRTLCGCPKVVLNYATVHHSLSWQSINETSSHRN